MAYKRLENRVADAFQSADAMAFGDKYIDLLNGNLRDTLTSLRRTLLLLILTGVAFLLLDSTPKGSQVAVGPFKINEVAPIVALVPAVTAHLMYESLLLFAAGLRYADIQSAYFKTQLRSLYYNDLELAIAPSTLSLSGDLPWRGIRDAAPGWQAKVLDKMDSAVTLVLLLGALGFLVYAYVHVFGSEASSILKWTSAGFAAFSVCRVGLLVSDEPVLRPGADRAPAG